MMSAALLLTADAEQGSTRSVSIDQSSDLGKPVGISFAESLSERVEESASLQPNNSADEMVSELFSPKGLLPVNKPDEVIDALGGVKKWKATAVKPEISVNDAVKSVVPGKIIQLRATAATVPHGEATVSDFGPENVELPIEGEESGDGVSLNDPISYTADAGLAGRDPASRIGIADLDRSLTLNGKVSLVQDQIEPAGKTQESAYAAKGEKIQTGVATPKTGQKPLAVNTAAAGIQFAPGNSTEVTASPMAQGVATSIVPNEISKTAETSRETVSAAAKASIGSVPVIVSNSERKETTDGTKESVLDSGMTMSVADDLVASSKPGTSLERMVAAVATLGSGDGDKKTQGSSVSVVTTVHSLAGDGLSTIVVPGNAPEVLVTTKLPIEQAGIHAVGTANGSSSHDGVDVVAASAEGLPRMLTATPTTLEIGIQNGTHGWLKVRAEMTDGGVVNASISSTSSEGQEMLHRELPALTAFLQEEKVAVSAIVVHAPLASGNESRNSTGADNSGGQTPQRSNEGEGQQQNGRKPLLGISGEGITYQGLHGLDEDGSSSLAIYESGGSWLSVRA